MSDGFFDMPAGYSDADMDMAHLEWLGNQHARRVRRFGEDNYRRLQAGETIKHPCKAKDTGEPYTVFVRLEDQADGEGGYLSYSMTGTEGWYSSSREARLGRSDYGFVRP